MLTSFEGALLKQASLTSLSLEKLRLSLFFFFSFPFFSFFPLSSTWKKFIYYHLFDKLALRNLRYEDSSTRNPREQTGCDNNLLVSDTRDTKVNLTSCGLLPIANRVRIWSVYRRSCATGRNSALPNLLLGYISAAADRAICLGTSSTWISNFCENFAFSGVERWQFGQPMNKVAATLKSISLSKPLVQAFSWPCNLTNPVEHTSSLLPHLLSCSQLDVAPAFLPHFVSFVCGVEWVGEGPSRLLGMMPSQHRDIRVLRLASCGARNSSSALQTLLHGKFMAHGKLSNACRPLLRPEEGRG
jgi:hypothetical protein